MINTKFFYVVGSSQLRAFVFLVSFLMLSGFPVRVLVHIENVTGITSVVPVIWFMLFALMFAYFLAGCLSGQIDVKLVVKRPYVMPLISTSTVWASLSFLWSVDPLTSIRLSVVLAGTVLIGLCSAALLTPKQTASYFLLSYLIIIFFSVFLYYYKPELVVHMDTAHYGRWKGVLTHKNHFGNLASLALVISAALVFESLREKCLSYIVFYLAAFVVAGVMLFFSGSVTALVVTLSGMCVLAVCLLRDRLAVGPIWYLVLVLFLLSLVVNNYDLLLGFVGKSSDLTGRVGIWSNLWREVMSRPIVGFGYDAYWGNTDTQSVYIPDWLKATHNGFLKIFLDQGLIGFIFIAVPYAIGLILFIRMLWLGEMTFDVVLAGVVLVMVFANNLTENTLTQSGSIFYCLWVYSAVLLSMRIKGHGMAASKEDLF